MNHTIIEQRTTEWYRMRLGKMTASGFGTLMAKPRDKNRHWAVKASEYIERKAFEVFLDKYIYDPPFSPEAADWGIENEARALDALRQIVEMPVQDVGLVFCDENAQIAATPDAALFDTGRGDYVSLVQVKCPYNGDYHEKFRTQVFNERDLKRKKSSYYWQMQGEMWVAGLDNSYFVSFDPRRSETDRLHTTVIHRNDDDLKILKERVFEALDERDKIVSDLHTGRRRIPPHYYPDYQFSIIDWAIGRTRPTLI